MPRCDERVQASEGRSHLEKPDDIGLDRDVGGHGTACAPAASIS
jgi:hypothetical protein